MSPTMTVTDEGFEVGIPVRVTWTDRDDEHHRPFREHIAARGLPGHRIVREGIGTGPGHDGVRYTEHTGIVVPLRAWEQPIGGYDEGSWPYVSVRPATDAEARHLLAEEERVETIRRLKARFRELTGERSLARDWADPNLSHIDISDAHLDSYLEEYRADRAREIRWNRHVRAGLDGYVLAVPGQDVAGVIYPDPHLRTVWYRDQISHHLVAYHYQGELAEVVDELIPLLRLEVTADTPRTMTRDAVAELWGISRESVRSTMRRHQVEPVARTVTGQAEYPRARVLNAHRERLGHGSWRNRRRSTDPA